MMATAGRLDVIIRAVSTSDLVGLSEIAARSGTPLPTLKRWRRRPDFPAPLVTLAAGPVWDWPTVAAWIAIPRPMGRPRKASQMLRGSATLRA